MKKRLIALMLSILLIVSLFPTTALALGETAVARDKAEDVRDRVEMNKTVTEHLGADGKPDGTYDITIDAYANGYYKPVDVVLVIDQSGSMSDEHIVDNVRVTNLAKLKEGLEKFARALADIDESNRLAIVGFASDGSDYENTELFVDGVALTYGTKNGYAARYKDSLDTSKTYQVRINPSDKDYKDASYDSQTATWRYTTGGGCGSNQEYHPVVPKTSVDDPTDGALTFYERVETATNQPTTEQYKAALAPVTINGEANPDLVNVITYQLDGSGGTYTQYGMEMAYNVLDNREDTSRDAIVVLFTDGWPGSGGYSTGKDSTNAVNKTTEWANKIKKTDIAAGKNWTAKIYTIGLDTGSEDETSHLKGLLQDICTDPNMPAQLDPEEKEYFRFANSNEDLPNIFGMIYTDTIGVNEAMTSASKLVETLSDQFELNGTPQQAIKVSKIPAVNKKDGGENVLKDGKPVMEWGTAAQIWPGTSAVSVGVTGSNDVITVSGFDYSVTRGNDINAVFYNSQGTYVGNKLRVVINVKPKVASDDCWKNIGYGMQEIPPTEKTAVVSGDPEQEIISMTSSKDSDFFEYFKVPLHHLRLQVGDVTKLWTGEELEGESFKSSCVTPATGYSVTAVYTPAKKTNEGDYTGEFQPGTKVEFGGEDVTRSSVIEYVPGVLHIVSNKNYVVTVNGENTTVTYDGQEHSAGFTYSVTKGGEKVDWTLGNELKFNGTSTVSGTNAGKYPLKLHASDFKVEVQGVEDSDVVFIVNDGLLYIKQREITFQSASASKKYDGNPLTKNESTDVWIVEGAGDGGFAKDEGATYDIHGTQTEIGESLNWYEVIPNKGTLKSNYNFTLLNGTLKVTADEPTRDIATPGPAQPGPTNPPIEPTPTIKNGATLTLDLNGGTFTSDPVGWGKDATDADHLKYSKAIDDETDLTDKAFLPTKNDDKGNAMIFDGWEVGTPDTDGDIVMTAKWLKDAVGGTNGSDGIPDDYQAAVTFKVVNGYYGTAGTTSKTVYVTLFKEGKWSTDTGAVGHLTAGQIPTPSANDGYVAATTFWTDAEPTTSVDITAEKTFTANYTLGNFDYSIKYYYDGTEGAAPSGASTGDKAAFDSTTSVEPNQQVTISGTPDKHYALDSVEQCKITSTVENNVVKVCYCADEKGTDPAAPETADGIPDKYQAAVTFKVVNGYYGTAGTTSKTVYVTLFKEGKWSTDTGAIGHLTTEQIPTPSANDGYSSGSWGTDVETPKDGDVIGASGAAYSYSYSPNKNKITYPDDKTPDGYVPENPLVEVLTGKKVYFKLVDGTVKDADVTKYSLSTSAVQGMDYEATVVGSATNELSFMDLIPTKIPTQSDPNNYVFMGWNGELDANGNLVLTAQWAVDNFGNDKAPDYKQEPDGIPDDYQTIISFYICDGAGVGAWDGDDQSVSNTTRIVRIFTLLKEGNWDTNGTATLKPTDVPSVKCDSHVGVTGVWKDSNGNEEPFASDVTVGKNPVTYNFFYKNPIKYFDGNNTCAVEDGADTFLTYGTAITTLKDGKKTGYTFKGWYSDKNCTNGNEVTSLPGDFCKSNAVSAVINLYAKFEVNELNATIGGEDSAKKIYDSNPFDISGLVVKSADGTKTLNPDGDYDVYFCLRNGNAEGNKTNNNNSGAASEGAAPVNAGKYYLVIQGTGDYSESKKLVPVEILVKVDYVLNGGTISNIPTTEITAPFVVSGDHMTTGVSYGEKLKEVVGNSKVAEAFQVSKSSNVFNGWYKTDEFTDGTKWNFSTDIADANIVVVYAKWSEKGAVSGIVYTKEGTPIADALVKLYEVGSHDCIGSVRSSEVEPLGYYCFENVAPGSYDIVVTTDKCTPVQDKTTIIVPTDFVNGMVSMDIYMPASNISSILVVDPNTPNIVVGNLDTEADSEATDYKKSNGQDSLNGKHLKVEMDVDLVENAVSVQAKGAQEIQNAAIGSKGEFYDIIVDQKIYDLNYPSNAPVITNIHKTDNLITVILGFDFANRTNVEVWLWHDDPMNGNVGSVDAGEVRKLPVGYNNRTNPDGEYVEFDQANNLITMHVKYFSLYAVTYDDVTPPPSSPATYQVIAPESTEDGKLTISSIWNNAGATVTLMPEADDTFSVGIINVTRKDNGKPVTLIARSNGTYTFTMPASDVYVSILFVLNTCPRDESCPIEKFADTANDAWWHDGIHYCIENNLMVGFPDGEFKPYGTTTRAQIVTMLWRLSGEPYVNYAMSFKDVSEDVWYTEAIRWAQSTGVVTGFTDEVFGPNEPITREQLATILWRYAKFVKADVSIGENTDIQCFEDADKVDGWAKDAMQWSCGAWIMSGSDGFLRPTDLANRAEAASMVYRFCETVLNLNRGIQIH